MSKGKRWKFISIVKKNCLNASLKASCRAVDEKTPFRRNARDSDCFKQTFHIIAITKSVFFCKKSRKCFMTFFWSLILTPFLSKFHCFSREANISALGLGRFKSLTKSSNSSELIRCGSTDGDVITYSLSPLLLDICDSGNCSCAFCFGLEGTGKFSLWGTGADVDGRFGYSIFFAFLPARRLLRFTAQK